jgi:hypothetical protein
LERLLIQKGLGFSSLRCEPVAGVERRRTGILVDCGLAMPACSLARETGHAIGRKNPLHKTPCGVRRIEQESLEKKRL